MGTPASNGKLCTKIEDMSIGDYIRCEYIAEKIGEAGIFQNLGEESSLNEIPAIPTETANGYFYFIKVDKGLLIADRRLQKAISAHQLNVAGYLNGITKNYNNKQTLIRSLSRDEFLNYISNSSLDGNIIPADANVWKGKVPGAVFNNFAAGKTWIDLVEINQDKNKDLIRVSFCMNGYEYNSSSYIGVLSQGGIGIPANIPFVVTENTTHSNLYDIQVSSYRQQNHFKAITSFRPALEFIDNEKSKLIWY